MGKYVIGIDQSTQGTKAVAFDENGKIAGIKSISHKQIVNDQGWVSHDLDEIYENCINAIWLLIGQLGLKAEQIACIGISNQRETTGIWRSDTGKPLNKAVVWQCSRAKDICEEQNLTDYADMIRERTGLSLSPYFPAAKLAWLLRNSENARVCEKNHMLCVGTIDTWLIYKLTHGRSYKTDYSNASRTQLFNIHTLQWDDEICRLFGIDPVILPEVCDSDAYYGETDLEGLLSRKIPIYSVMGDSHAALFGEGCTQKGMTKVTYGTGSSIMMNTENELIKSNCGLSATIGWCRHGKVSYALEGNINYAGAVITWLKDSVGLIGTAAQSESLAMHAVKDDELYFIPAFTGLGAPYWNSDVRGAYIGIDRTTGRKEMVRAGLESIAYQITDVIRAMENDTGDRIVQLHADGGPTHNKYLMQFQSDILQCRINVPDAEIFSAIGVSYMAGISCGIYVDGQMNEDNVRHFIPFMEKEERDRKYNGWKAAIGHIL